MDNAQDQARDYSRIRYRILLFDLGVSLVFLAFVQLSGVSVALTHFLTSEFSSQVLITAAYLTILGALYYLLTLPVNFYSSFTLEHQFGLSRLTILGWIKRELKHVAVSATLSLLLLEGFYMILRHAPRQWPMWATIGWIGVSVILARIFPTVLLPIFYKTRRLEDESLVKRLLDLCNRTGLSVLGVFRFDLGAETRKANAALTGLGKTRRVIVSDTLIQEFTPEEIEGVLAHELGHQRYRHIIKLLAISALGSWVAFSATNMAALRWISTLSLRGISDIAGFPILMLFLSLLGLIGLPLQNWLSRYFEWQADRFAIKTTSFPSAYAKALRKLMQLNLSDPIPPRWVVWLFYDHPPITERIQAAEQVTEDNRGSGFGVQGSGQVPTVRSPQP